MKIVVISDTHGENILGAVREIENIDIIIHLGDYYKDVFPLEKVLKTPIYYVKGNCDFAPDVPTQLMIELSNKKVFLTHGHWYNVKLGIDELKDKTDETNADLVLYGHTHESDISMYKKAILLNPGSATTPNTGYYPTIGIVNIVDNKIEASIKRIV